MTQTQAVEEIIRRLGGLATLKQIYKHIHEIEDCKWNTKTPDASIRRIVQLDKNIIRVAPGIWCLKTFANEFAKEQVGDHIPVDKVIQRLMSIPSADKRYEMYVNLNTMFQGTSWDLYSQAVLNLLQQHANETSNINFYGSVGQVIAHADIHHD